LNNYFSQRRKEAKRHKALLCSDAEALAQALRLTSFAALREMKIDHCHAAGRGEAMLQVKSMLANSY
jgi:hypothetical protein